MYIFAAKKEITKLKTMRLIPNTHKKKHKGQEAAKTLIHKFPQFSSLEIHFQQFNNCFFFHFMGKQKISKAKKVCLNVYFSNNTCFSTSTRVTVKIQKKEELD